MRTSPSRLSGCEVTSASGLCELTIAECADRIRARALSPVDLTRAYLDRIAELNPAVNAYITVLRDEALESAHAAEAGLATGRQLGPLYGVPIAVKDLFASKGHRTTCGSRILKDNVTSFDATAVARLRQAGCVLLGKLTMSEFALGDDVNPLTGVGPTRNPWNLERSCSGSSSGSGAAVSASLCAAALGTDTGGSIRLPAGFCGIVGMKPTFGRVSRHGVTPLAWSLDTAGPMTRTVEDNAIVLQAIAGADRLDASCSSEPVPDYRASLGAGAKGLRVGLPKRYFLEYATVDTAEAVREAAKALERLGATVYEVDLPHCKYALGAEYAIIFTESLAYHAKYLRQGKFDLYTAASKVNWDAGRLISAADYTQAQRLRRFLIRDFEKAYGKVDVIFTPSTGIEASSIREEQAPGGVPARAVPAGHITPGEMSWRMPSPANLAGVPTLALPCGFSREGLPLGLQIMGRHWDESTVYRAGAAYERATDWHTRRPKFLHMSRG
jgi:aspartyl-tRNA(Asn)/glutamyl-tRNA(Gln) amidotransferase subunit A